MMSTSDGAFTIVAGVLFAIAAAVWLLSFTQMRRRQKREDLKANRPEAANRAASKAQQATRMDSLVRMEHESPTVLGWSSDTGGENGEGIADADGKQVSSANTPVLSRGKTILIADDDPVISVVLSRHLEHLGYKVFRTADATNALFGTKKILPDLAILDLEMPSGNGLAVCEMLSCDRQCANIPIIVHSISDDDTIKRRCKQLRAYYVRKSPRSWSEIKQLVEFLLENIQPMTMTIPQPTGVAIPQPTDVAVTEPTDVAITEPAEAPLEKPTAESAPAMDIPPGPTHLAPGELSREPFDEDAMKAAWPVADSPAASDREDSADRRMTPPLDRLLQTVLCIDDDPVVIRTIITRLKPYGIKVRGVDNGAQGYLSVLADPPSLILLDLKMPNESGNYILSKLKENSDTKDIPVIILTMETTAGVQRLITSLGADGYVTKPIYWPDLFEQMGRCIQLPKQVLIDYNLPEQLVIQR
jgi:CheY-like chemotaxis protein